MSDQVFKVQNLMQYTLIANDQQLACILKEISDNPVDINFVVFKQTLLKGGCSLLKLVPGTIESNVKQDSKSVVELRSILDTLCVEYSTEVVLNVSPQNHFRVQALLSAVDNDIISASDINNLSTVYEVCDNELAKTVLELPKDDQDYLITETLKCNENKCRTICSKKKRPNCGKCCKKNKCCEETTCNSCCSTDDDDDRCKPICDPCNQCDNTKTSKYATWKKW